MNPSKIVCGPSCPALWRLDKDIHLQLGVCYYRRAISFGFSCVCEKRERERERGLNVRSRIVDVMVAVSLTLTGAATLTSVWSRDGTDKASALHPVQVAVAGVTPGDSLSELVAAYGEPQKEVDGTLSFTTKASEVVRVLVDGDERVLWVQGPVLEVDGSPRFRAGDAIDPNIKLFGPSEVWSSGCSESQKYRIGIRRLGLEISAKADSGMFFAGPARVSRVVIDGRSPPNWVRERMEMRYRPIPE